MDCVARGTQTTKRYYLQLLKYILVYGYDNLIGY